MNTYHHNPVYQSLFEIKFPGIPDKILTQQVRKIICEEDKLSIWINMGQ